MWAGVRPQQIAGMAITVQADARKRFRRGETRIDKIGDSTGRVDPQTLSLT